MAQRFGTAQRTRPRRRLVAFIPVAVTALLSGGVVTASAAPPTSTDGTSVSHWNQVAATTLAAIPAPDGGAPVSLQINLAMTQGAVYDAVNAIGPKRHQPYLLDVRTGAKASVDAAVATAAYDVLTNLVSTAPERAPFPGRAGLLSSLSTQYNASLAGIADNAFKRQGVSIGHAAAKAMIDARANDGRFGPSQWVSNTGVGHWQPLTNPTTGAQILDPTPWVGGVKPFLVQSATQFRTPPPPALDSAQWATEFNEVKLLGRADSTVRTADQTFIARWWQSAPGLSWSEVARELIARNHLTAADSARLLALLNMAGADAAITVWNEKYHYDFWRPWNAIPRAAEDGNAATVADATWTPLFSAPYPEAVSGHLSLDGAEVAVLRAFFGDTPGGYSITSFSTVFPTAPPAAAMVRSFSTFSGALSEIVEARIWAGLHYRFSDVAGQSLGEHVAAYGMANGMQPVGN